MELKTPVNSRVGQPAKHLNTVAAYPPGAPLGTQAYSALLSLQKSHIVCERSLTQVEGLISYAWRNMALGMYKGKWP